MQVKFVFPVFFYCALLSGWAWLTGCSKHEQAIDEARFTTLDIKTFSIDTLRLKVLENETLLTDSLPAPDGAKNIAVQYYDFTHRIRLSDAFSNRLLLDTTIDYKPGFTNTLTFFQPAADANFIWIGPPVNEPQPPAGNFKIAVSYTHAGLPELVKVVVKTKPASTYLATDSFELKKGEFSKYFLTINKADKRPRIEFYRTDGKKELLGQIDEFSYPVTMNPDYNIILIRKHKSKVNEVLGLVPEKLY